MEVFLLIDGEKTGPHTLYEVREILRAGKIEPTTKAWMRGMEQWAPLNELGPLQGDTLLRVAAAGAEDIVVSDEERAAIIATAGESPRPWRRFWARNLDIWIFSTLVLFGVKLANLTGGESLINAEGSNLAVMLAIPAAWIFVEAALLLYFKTTPGKWLLNVRLRRRDGEPLEFGQSLRRSISVWWRGWGIGIFPVQLVCWSLSHLALTAQGATYWDTREELEVEYGPLQDWRVFVTTTLIAGSIYACYHLLGFPEELARYLEKE